MQSAFFAIDGPGGPTILAGQSPVAAYPAASGQKGFTPHLQQKVPPRVASPGNKTQMTAQAVPWRPPATRRFLWDRTPQGPAIVSDLANTKLQLAIPPNTWKLLHRLHQGAGGTVTLSGRVTSYISAGGAVQLELCTGAPNTADIVVPVTVLGSAAAASVPPQPASQLNVAYEVACSRQQSAGAPQLLQASATSSITEDGSISLHGVAAVPAPVITFRPILAKCVSPQPLSKALQDTLRGPSVGAFQEGFLSMDQGRSVVPLATDDPVAYAVPLMGVWVAGADSVRHPLVAAACIKYLCSRALADKALELDSSFLLLLYAPGKATVPNFYECHISLDSGAVSLKAKVFVAMARSSTKDPTLCDLSPAGADVDLPGCPVSTGRRHSQGAATAAQASERFSWHAGSKRSPGPAGSWLSISSAYPSRSNLRTGESPTILPPCSPPSGMPTATHLVQPPVWPNPQGELPMARSAGARSQCCPEATAPAAPSPTGTAVRPAQSSSQKHSGLLHTEPACKPVEAVDKPYQPTAPATIGEPICQPISEPLPALGAEPPGSCSPGLHTDCNKDLAPATQSASAGAAVPADGCAEGASSTPVELPSEPWPACERSECSCHEEGSMPSLAGWSASLHPADRGSTASSQHGGSSEQELPLPEQQHQQAKQGPAAGCVPASEAAPAPACKFAYHPSSAYGMGAGSHVLYSYGGGVPWVLQPPPEPVSWEVAVLQQEVIMLRQQVQMLQCQLQAVQAHVVPPYMAAISESWGMQVAGVHWPPPHQVFPRFSQGPAPPTASVQHSCSVVGNSQATPTSQACYSAAAASQQGSPAAISVAGAEGSAASPSSDRGLIPAFREPACSPPTFQQPSSVLGQPPGMACKRPPELPASCEPASPPAAPQPEPAPPVASAQDPQPCEALLGVGFDCGSRGPPNPATVDLASVTDAEADIDRLIADVERAMSVLSCYSDGAEDAQDSLSLSPTADSLPCQPSCSAAGARPPPAGSCGAAPPSPPLSLQLPSIAAAGPMPGVVRVKIPSFMEFDDAVAEDDEDDDAVEKLEKKYGLRRDLAAGKGLHMW